MSKKILFPIFVGVVFVVGGFFWAKSGTGDSYTQSSGLEFGGLEEPGQESKSSAKETLSELQAEETTPAGTRETLPEIKVDPLQQDRELAGAASKSVRWLEGTVILPEGTPVDESIEVIARGGIFEGSKPERRTHRVPIDRNGSFRVAIAKNSKRAKLQIDATYCFLEWEFDWSDKDEEPIELRPELGIAAQVFVTTSGGGQTVFKDFDARVHIYYQYAGESNPSLLEGNRLFLKALPIYGGWLEVKARGYASHAEPLLTGDEYGVLGGMMEQGTTGDETEQWEPGTRQSITIVLQPEARIEGELSDDLGNAVQEGMVYVYREAVDRTNMFGNGVAGVAVKDGKFVLPALAAGDYRAAYAGYGLLFEDKLVPNLRVGETREIKMTGQRGLGISGRVTWATGEPAVGVEVKLLGRGTSVFDSQTGPPGKVLTDAEGKFSFTGFEDVESFGLMASGIPPGVDPPESKSKLKMRRWKRENVVLASQDGLRPGGPHVELVLGLETAKLTGRVVNDKGEPVTRFRVSATPLIGLEQGSSEGSQRNKFSDDNGAFELSKLTPGRWSIEASAMGHRSAAVQMIDLPNSEPLLFTLPRSASISGKVVNSKGKPLNSNVDLEWLGPVTEDEDAWEKAKSADSSSASGFNFTGLDAGTWQVTAGSYLVGSSDSLTIELKVGEKRKDLVLTMPEPGRLEGTVHADWRRGDISVSISSKDDVEYSFDDSATVSPDGRFVFKDVPPGAYETALVRHFEGSDDSYATGLRLEVSVQSGVTSVLHFDGFPAGSIQLSGRLLRADKPVTNGHIQFAPGEWDQDVGAFTDAKGRYEVVLLKPGEYTVTAREEGSWSSERSWTKSIAGSGKQSLDLVFPSNKLLVKLQLESGGPLGEGEVNNVLNLTSARGGESIVGEQDGRGQVLFEGLSAGEYDVGYSTYGYGDNKLVVVAPLAVTVVEGPEVQEVAVTLGKGCTVWGEALGVPNNGDLWVYVYKSETGDDWQDLTSVEDGVFRLEDLPPGEFWLAGEADGRMSSRVKVVLERGSDMRADVRF